MWRSNFACGQNLKRFPRRNVEMPEIIHATQPLRGKDAERFLRLVREGLKHPEILATVDTREIRKTVEEYFKNKVES
jgi:hypothetical protein